MTIVRYSFDMCILNIIKYLQWLWCHLSYVAFCIVQKSIVSNWLRTEPTPYLQLVCPVYCWWGNGHFDSESEGEYNNGLSEMLFDMQFDALVCYWLTLQPFSTIRIATKNCFQVIKLCNVRANIHIVLISESVNFDRWVVDMGAWRGRISRFS